MSTRRGKRYSTQSFKKKETAQQDPYAMRRAPKGPAVCRQCHAIFAKKRWSFDESKYLQLKAAATTRLLQCPACRKIRDQYPEGILTLKWPSLKEHAADVTGLIRNEEARAMAVNPLERVMKIVTRGQTMEVQTTNDRLAQRIGRELVRAYKGEVAYHWSHKDKLTRVEWRGPVRPKEARKRSAG